VILQLNPPIPVITIKGKGVAHVLIDHGRDNDLVWVVFQEESGECWTWRSCDIRSQDGIGLGKSEPTLPANKEFWNMLLSS
jgi:hypothetical protein